MTGVQVGEVYEGIDLPVRGLIDQLRPLVLCTMEPCTADLLTGQDMILACEACAEVFFPALMLDEEERIDGEAVRSELLAHRRVCPDMALRALAADSL